MTMAVPVIRPVGGPRTCTWITQADELYVRLSGMPAADRERRRAWRVAA